MMQHFLFLLVTLTEAWVQPSLRPRVPSAVVQSAMPWAGLFASGAERGALEAAAGGDDAALLRAIEKLERTPPSLTLLDDPKTAAALDGRWRLLSTLAATVGEDISMTARRGVVNASGLVLAAADDNVPIQEIDVASGRIGNELRLAAPVFGSFYARVSGRFSRGTNNACRAVVEFDELAFFDADGREFFCNRWIFALARRLKPDLINGDDSASWLETTYLSDRIRVGRGNKGSIFLLDRATNPPPLKTPLVRRRD